MARTNEQTLKVLHAKKEQYFVRVQTLYNYSKTVFTSERDLKNFKIRVKSLEETKVAYCKIIDEINALNLEMNPEAELNFQPLEAFDDLYCHILDTIEEIANKSDKNIVTAATEIPPKNIPRLPKLELPSFSGEIKDWPIFYECFKSLIHDNNSLNSIDKVHYLVGKLSGKALAVCTGVPPIGDNYEIIWEALKNKYQDPRILANNYLEQMLDFKAFSGASLENLNSFLEKFDTATNALKRLDITDLSDFILSYLAMSKLDPETKRLFENSRRQSTIPTHKEIIDFVKEQAKIFARSQATGKSSSISRSRVTQSFVVQDSVAEKLCAGCNKAVSHSIVHCSTFLNNTPSERYKLVKQKNLCLNCLGSHKIIDCKSKARCKTCKYKHNTLLHFNKSTLQNSSDPVGQNNIPATNVASHSQVSSAQSSIDSNSGFSQQKINSSSQVGQNPTSFCSTTNFQFSSTVLLSTIVVDVIGIDHKKQKVRFLLDSGSQGNFLTFECAKRLKLNVLKKQLAVMGMGGLQSSVHGTAHIVVASRFNPNRRYLLDVYIVDKITDKLPNATVQTDSLSHLMDLPLADNAFNVPSKVDGVIGAELYALVIGQSKIIGPNRSPVAIETSFGYVVMGSAPTVDNSGTIQNFCSIMDPPLETLVSKFFQLEDIPTQTFVNSDDLECENIYKSNYFRDLSGRYVVPLPFKESPTLLGDSYNTALKRFLALEKKFKNLPEYKTQYTSVIKAYIQAGYISKVEIDEITSPCYYIPHHGILKIGSSTPLRCVLDASAKTCSSISLNQLLYTGPKLQSDIVTILLNFRLFETAFTADIREMYLQIGIRDEHKRFQRILWRFSPDDPIGVYNWNRVAFGVNASPFLAIRTIHQLAADEAQTYPLASSVIKRDFYMDDFVSCVSTPDEAIVLYHQLIDLFKTAHFDLIKWSVNSKKLLQEIPLEYRSPKVVQFETSNVKILGVQWHPNSDIFSFQIVSENLPCTKRNVLSTVARLFDPLGFLAPVTLGLKLLIKKLWALNINWDDTPPNSIVCQWDTFKRELPLLSNFKIDRHLGILENSSISLIGFTDACLTSFGSAVYLRVIQPNSEVKVGLVCAKSKVSPMKSISIPRLELCAAHLLAKLLNYIIETYSSRIKISEVYALSDSTVALSWINSPSYKWKSFVANRVSKIRELTPPSCWFHVDGRENISDCLSRGQLPLQFMVNTTWITGPPWLHLDKIHWPIRSLRTEEVSVLEQKPVVLVIADHSYHPLYSLIKRCSSWQKLLHVTVYVLRFCRILPKRDTVTVTDLDKAEITLIKLVQRIHFASEIASLEQGQLCSPALRPLCPFLKDGLVRVGGRLRNSQLNYDQKHPCLLPKKDHLVDLLIDYVHQKNLHTGPHFVLSILRQKYWIMAARNTVRFRINKCNYCFRFRPKATFPLMADLPSPRVTEAKPFLFCGVDYAGPYYITLGRRRGVKSQKAYLCLFICLATKAVHLELASSLSTDIFLAAFKRFLARRGAVSVMYSDNGTNFIGAKAALDSVYELVNSKEYNRTIQNDLVQRRIEWRLQPPYSPHFSGIWEGNIKSVKSHLSKVIGSQILTYEEFSTVLAQTEALLNSRPLCWLSSDPSEPLALTPAHFLTLTPLESLPAPDVENQNPNCLNRKELLDKIVQTLWRKWHVEYLNQLQIRQKWNTPSCPVTPGTLVVVRQDHVPPFHWPLGVIEEVFPGKDGIVRVANVRIRNTVFKRPVVRLCPLPTQ